MEIWVKAYAISLRFIEIKLAHMLLIRTGPFHGDVDLSINLYVDSE
jgi:hypothetical protein